MQKPESWRITGAQAGNSVMRFSFSFPNADDDRILHHEPSDGHWTVANKPSGEGNEAVITGSTTNLNASVWQLATNGLVSVSYRGEENLGNIWKWVGWSEHRTGLTGFMTPGMQTTPC